MWNICLKSGGGGLLGGRLGTSFVYMLGSNIKVIEGYVGRNLVGLTLGGEDVAYLGIYDSVRGGEDLVIIYVKRWVIRVKEY